MAGHDPPRLRLSRHELRPYDASTALTAFVGLLLAAVLSDEFETVVRRTPFRLVAAVTAMAALLHPAGRHFFRSFRVSRINWAMVALVGVAALPLLAYASTNIGLQGSVRDEHFAMGHYAFMAAWSFTVVGVGLLASLRPDGWRLPAWVAGMLSALIGISSLLYPEAASSLDPGWALASIAWGGVFVAVTEIAKETEGRKPPGSRRVGTVSGPLRPGRAARHSTRAG